MARGGTASSTAECAQRISTAHGTNLFGIAHLQPSLAKTAARRCGFLPRSSVSIGIAIPAGLPMSPSELPNGAYAKWYKKANRLLDEAARTITEELRFRGFNAVAIEASRITSEARLTGALPHKTFARLSGLGWIGRSLLLVTPEFGPRVRLATVLTDAMLEPSGKPMKSHCGRCTACVFACPAGALKTGDFADFPRRRSYAFSVGLCNAHLFKQARRPSVGERICGVCVAACPWGAGRKSLSRCD
jgi:epoxyqueuosine reductase